MDWDILTKIIIALVAIYGAGVSTYNLVIKRKETNVGAKIELKYSSLPNNPQAVITSNKYSNATPELIVIITNVRKRQITMRLPFFKLPSKETLVCPNPMSSHRFPAELNEGGYLMELIRSSEIANGFKNAKISGSIKLVAFCQDTIGHVYKSKPLKFNVDEILEMNPDANNAI